MKRVLLAMMVLLLLFAGNSFAEVYKWVDEAGDVHFTDDFSQIPEKYRPSVEKNEFPETVESQQAEEPSASTTKSQEDSYKDTMGNGETYWKGRVAEWKKRLKETQEKLDALRMKYNDLTVRLNDSKFRSVSENIRQEREQVKNEMDQCKVEYDKAREMLEKKIPEEANLYKAKPEWLK